MALPTILFNSSTGSDTAASGAGPATALFGTGASLNGTTTVTLSADTPNLSGVATDGSAVLWVDTTSGRQFSRITGVDDGADTVTVATTFSVTETGRNWGIGGKRATFDNADSRTLFGANGAEADWIIETETDQNVTGSAIVVATTASIKIRGNSTTTRRTISNSANAAVFSLTAALTVSFENLNLENTNGTKTAADGITSSANVNLRCRRVRFGHATNTLRSGIRRSAGTANVKCYDCEVLSCTDVGLQIRTFGDLVGCFIHNNTSHGVSSDGETMIEHSIVSENGGDGVNIAATGTLREMSNCTVHGNTGDGVDTTAAAGVMAPASVFNNNFTGNGGYGINAAASSNPSFLDYNNFGTGGTANTSGSMANLTAGSNDLAVDPGYTNQANDDYSVGTNVKALGFPNSTRNIGANPTNGTKTYVDVGAAQRQEAASSGSGSSGNFFPGGNVSF